MCVDNKPIVCMYCGGYCFEFFMFARYTIYKMPMLLIIFILKLV